MAGVDERAAAARLDPGGRAAFAAGAPAAGRSRASPRRCSPAAHLSTPGGGGGRGRSSPARRPQGRGSSGDALRELGAQIVAQGHAAPRAGGVPRARLRPLREPCRDPPRPYAAAQAPGADRRACRLRRPVRRRAGRHAGQAQAHGGGMGRERGVAADGQRRRRQRPRRTARAARRSPEPEPRTARAAPAYGTGGPGTVARNQHPHP